MTLRKRRRGVSLVEVMVVVAILLVLMTVLAVGVTTAWQRMQVSTSRLAVQRVAQDVKIYEFAQRGAPRATEGLAAVYVNEPIPKDAWGTDIQYESPKPDWDVLSLGADRVRGGTGYDSDLRWSDERR